MEQLESAPGEAEASRKRALRAEQELQDAKAWMEAARIELERLGRLQSQLAALQQGRDTTPKAWREGPGPEERLIWQH